MDPEKKPNFLVPGSILGAGVIVALSIVYVFGGARPTTPPPGITPPPAPSGTVEDGNDPVLGNPDAKVTVVEFSDFQCPFCGRLWADTLPKIKNEYIKTGKVRFVYRDFPLSAIHPEANKAAEASECAHEQNKFWEYHDILFGRQQTLSIANYKAWARELGLNSTQFDSCLDSGKYADEVAKDLADGVELGVNGTPATFINGVMLASGGQSVGAAPFEVFKAAIDAALAK